MGESRRLARPPPCPPAPHPGTRRYHDGIITPTSAPTATSTTPAFPCHGELPGVGGHHGPWRCGHRPLALLRRPRAGRSALPRLTDLLIAVVVLPATPAVGTTPLPPSWCRVLGAPAGSPPPPWTCRCLWAPDAVALEDSGTDRSGFGGGARWRLTWCQFRCRWRRWWRRWRLRGLWRPRGQQRQGLLTRPGTGIVGAW